jgi:hypothetical protein
MTTDGASVQLCSEAAERAAMSDDDFWAHVFLRGQTEPSPLVFPEIEADLDEAPAGQPCPECGELGACGYDSEGRPMIHSIQVGSPTDD